MSAVSATYPLPGTSHVKDLLGMLFEGLTVKLGPKLDVSPKANSYFGVYVSGGAPVALCGCDMAFAVNAGASLSLRPAPQRKRQRGRYSRPSCWAILRI